MGIFLGWTISLTTNSEKNILKTLNYKNAFDVYKSIVEKNSGMIFSDA